MAWILQVVVDTDHDLSNREGRRELERLFQGHSSKIKFDELLDVEIIDAEKEKRK